MKTPVAIALLLISIISFSAAGQTKIKKPTLNGKIFMVEFTNTTGEKTRLKWKKDEISFNAGRLNSKVMSAKEGFPSAKCTLTVDSSAADAIHFQGKHQNAGASEIIWDGTVTGDDIEGTAEWTNLQGSFTFTFTGTLKGKKKK